MYLMIEHLVSSVFSFLSSIPPFMLIAQTVGIVAMAFNILSYQQKGSKGVIVMQLFGGALFSVHFFMIGATVGGILNLIAAFRAIIFANREKFKADHLFWLILFISLYVGSYILVFTAFGKAFTLTAAIIELLPVIAMTATTFGFRSSSAKIIRRFSLISSPSWLVYNIVNVSVGAIICEVFSLFSIVIGILRYDIKREEE